MMKWCFMVDCSRVMDWGLLVVDWGLLMDRRSVVRSCKCVVKHWSIKVVVFRNYVSWLSMHWHTSVVNCDRSFVMW
jgi:hypothetical protein